MAEGAGRARPEEADRTGQPRPLRRVAAALAGPTVIAVSVLVVMHQFAFAGRLAPSDLSTYFLPTYCFLGKSLAGGHIPAWNPYTLAGTPFAADPQSGWMYAPAMLLFTVLPCGAAIQVMVVVQPILAGLGLLWFLRIEGVSRPVATTGGLALALGVAGSTVGISLPFAGALAWSAILLALAARYVRARSTPGRLTWLGLVALAWGQLAAAHFSTGLVIGTAALGAYLVATAWRNVREGAWSISRAALQVGGLIPAMALLNLAYLVPRLAYTSEASLGLGYGKLQQLAQQLAHRPVTPRQVGPAGAPTWPLDLGAAPGAHLGAVVLALSFAALWSRRRRHFAVAFSVFGGVAYILSLRVVAKWILSWGPSLRVVDFYLRRPEWVGYGLLLAIAVLAAFGIEAWLEAPSNRTRVLMVAPGVAVWGVAAVALRPGLTFVLLGIGAVAGGAALWLARRRRAWATVLPLVLAGELVANGLMSFRPLPFEPAPALLLQLPAATIHTGAYAAPGPIALKLRSLGPGRVIDLNLPGWRRLLADPLSTTFKVEQAGGYNPAELRRYWIFVRALTPRVLDHNLSIFYQPPPVLLDLLNVRSVVAPTFPLGVAFEGPLAEQGVAKLFAIRGAAPRAMVLGGWRWASTPEGALQDVIAPGFDPDQALVVECAGRPSCGQPSLGPPGALGTATYAWLGTQAARVVVDARSSAMVLVRNPYARGWHAQVDGVEAKVYPADYVDQAVAVPAGRHVISLAYDDPTIGYGLLGSGLSLAGLVIALFVLARRRRGIERPRPTTAVPTPQSTQPGRSR